MVNSSRDQMSSETVNWLEIGQFLEKFTQILKESIFDQ